MGTHMYVQEEEAVNEATEGRAAATGIQRQLICLSKSV